MRKPIVMMVAALFGIGVGLSSSDLWVRVHTIPYCKVATNADSYDARFIRVRARVFFSDGGISVYEDCDPVEALAARVEFAESPGPGHYLKALMLTGQQTAVKTADAIIEGEFNGHYSRGCYGPKFHITARKIELISDVTDYVPPQTDGPPIRIKH